MSTLRQYLIGCIGETWGSGDCRPDRDEEPDLGCEVSTEHTVFHLMLVPAQQSSSGVFHLKWVVLE